MSLDNANTHTHTVCETSVVAGRPRGIGTGDCAQPQERFVHAVKKGRGRFSQMLVNNILSDDYMHMYRWEIPFVLPVLLLEISGALEWEPTQTGKMIHM